MTRVGFCTCSIVQAMVALLPEPVMPSRVCHRSPLAMPWLSAATAPAWSPAGANSDTILNGVVDVAAIAGRLYRRGVTSQPGARRGPATTGAGSRASPGTVPDGYAPPPDRQSSGHAPAPVRRPVQQGGHQPRDLPGGRPAARVRDRGPPGPA